MESEKNDALVPEEQLNNHVEDTVDATPAAETEVVEEEDFLANVCPLNPDNLEECTACQ